MPDSALDHIDLVEADDDGATFTLDEIGDPDVLLLERRLRIDEDDHDFGKTDGVEGVGDRELLELLLDTRTAAQAGGIVDAHSPPCQSRSTAMASRVMPASGPVTSRSSPSSRLINVDLPVLGRPTMAMRIGSRGFSRRGLLVGPHQPLGRLRKCCAKRVVKIRQSFPMLRADRHRIAQSERVAFERARFAGAAFALVGDQNRRLAGFAHKIRESPIGRGRARTRIDQKQDRVRLRHCRRGLRLHLSCKTFGSRTLETGRVDHPKRKIAEPSLALPPIARDARLVIDQRQPRPDQRLNSVDLPTLGRPTMAIVKDMEVFSEHSRSGASAAGNLAL